MEKQIIGRGVLAGLIAGVFAFVFARIFVEPVIDRAIAFEDSLAEAEHAAEGHDHEVEVVSRTVQQNLGMGIERDILFAGDYPLSVYAQAARTAGRIVIAERSLRAAAAALKREG